MPTRLSILPCRCWLCDGYGLDQEHSSCKPCCRVGLHRDDSVCFGRLIHGDLPTTSASGPRGWDVFCTDQLAKLIWPCIRSQNRIRRSSLAVDNNCRLSMPCRHAPRNFASRLRRWPLTVIHSTTSKCSSIDLAMRPPASPTTSSSDLPSACHQNHCCCP